MVEATRPDEPGSSRPHWRPRRCQCRPTYPGVYIEERPSGVHTIVGVSTSVTAFVGAAATGPGRQPAARSSASPTTFALFGPPIDEHAADGPRRPAFLRQRRLAGDDRSRARRPVRSRRPRTLKETLARRNRRPHADRQRQGRVGELDRQRRHSTSRSTARERANPDDLFNARRHVQDARSANRTPPVAERAGELPEPLDVAEAPALRAQRVAASQLVVPSLPGTLTSDRQGHRRSGAAAVANPLTIKATAKTLRVSVDFGPAVDLVLFPAMTTDVSKTPAQIATELNAALANAGLAATGVAVGRQADDQVRQRRAWTRR